MNRSDNLTEWQRRVALDFARACPLEPVTPIRATGNSLAAENDEPEPMESAPEFLIDGTRYSLAEVLEGNADSPEVCAWARQAKPGDVFADVQRVECVAAGGCSDAGLIDRGPLTQPAELTEADWEAADLAEDQGKAQRRHRINDAAAIELQLVEFRARGYV